MHNNVKYSLTSSAQQHGHIANCAAILLLHFNDLAIYYSCAKCFRVYVKNFKIMAHRGGEACAHLSAELI